MCKKPLSQFSTVKLLLGMEPTLECGWYTQWPSIGENGFPFPSRLSVAGSFLVKGGLCFHFLFSVLGFCLVLCCVVFMCAVTVSVSSPFLLCPEDYFLSYLPTLALKNLPATFAWILEPWGEVFIKDIPFRAECSKVTLPIVQLWVCVNYLYYKEKLLRWGLNDALLCGYSNMFLRVVLCYIPLAE